MAFTGIRDYRTDDPTGLREDLLRQNEAIEAAFRDVSITSAARYLPRKVSRDVRVAHGEALLVDATRAVTLYLPESTQQTRGRLIRVQRMAGTETISVAASGGQLVQGATTDTLDRQVTVREYMDDGDGNWWRAEKAAITSGLSNVIWVDAAAPTGGDGSDESPYNTFSAGVAAVPTGGTLLVCGGTYTGEATANTTTKTIVVRGMGSSDEVLLPDITWSAGAQLHLHDCQVELVGTEFATVRLLRSAVASTGTNCAATFTVTAGAFQGNHSGITARDADVSGGLTASGAATVTLSHCAVDDVVTSGGAITTLDCSFSSGAVLTASTITMDRASERRAAMAGAVPSVLPTPLEEINPIYGSGITGNTTQSTSVNLDLAAEYSNLTMASGGRITLQSGILRVRNLLDLTAADGNSGSTPPGCLRDWAGGPGADASGATGGASWGGTGGLTQGNSGTLQAPSGANGTTGAGAQPTNVPTLDQSFGGGGGGVDAGGGGGKGGTSGGGGRPAATVTNKYVSPHWPLVFSGPSSVPTAGSTVTAPVPIMGGHVGQAGSAGGGDAATGTGGGGGGAGRGGGSVVIYARGIALGASTPTPAIVCRGHAGGKGGSGDVAGTSCGGGSGGAGGGGGLVFVAYDWIIGSPPAGDELDATGGAGGAGGAGAGTIAAGGGGSGGGGGDGGQIVTVNLLTGVRTVVTGSAGSAGGAASGSSGGSGGAAGTCTADLA